MYLVDTDWLIQVFNNRTAFVGELNRLFPFGLAVSVVTLGELWEGVQGSKDPAKTQRSVVHIEQTLRVLDLTPAIAKAFGDLRFDLRRRGQLIGDMDLLIAATAIHHRLTLCTQNVKHFGRLSGLSLLSVTP